MFPFDCMRVSISFVLGVSRIIFASWVEMRIYLVSHLGRYSVLGSVDRDGGY